MFRARRREGMGTQHLVSCHAGLTRHPVTPRVCWIPAGVGMRPGEGVHFHRRISVGAAFALPRVRLCLV
jgi:hypothetical protein